ncbi:MAG: hypothetical protein RSB99_00770 [Bacilli bacterium]
MKDFLKQYCKIVSYSFLGLVFAFASFYLIINLYHQAEIAKTFSVSISTDATVGRYNNMLDAIKSNLSNFDVNNYKGKLTSFQMMGANQKLTECYQELNNDVMKDFQKKTELSIVDIYQLRESFENNILGKCVVSDLMWFANATENKIDSPFLKQNEKMLNLYLNGLKSETSYLKKDLLNNSSYYFNTELVSNTIRNNVKDGYYELMTS